MYRLCKEKIDVDHSRELKGLQCLVTLGFSKWPVIGSIQTIWTGTPESLKQFFFYCSVNYRETWHTVILTFGVAAEILHARLLTLQEAFDIVLLVLYVVLTFESYGMMKQLLFEVFEKSRIIKVKERDLFEAYNTYWDLDQSGCHKIQTLLIKLLLYIVMKKITTHKNSLTLNLRIMHFA